MRPLVALGALAAFVLAFAGCPPRPTETTMSSSPARPHTLKVPAGFRVENCRYIPDAPQGEVKCFHDWEWRPSSIVDECPRGSENDHGLCYPPCRPGYAGNGPVCWQSCPPGYHDDGATCRRDLSIISATRDCPWYDVCGLTFARGCTKCPEGYRNDGCTCVRDVRITAKDTYGRGVGAIPGCPRDQEQIGLSCYGDCDRGFHADGMTCTADAETCTTVPVQPSTPLSMFCIRLEQPGFCTISETVADTAENALALAQCSCTNCAAELVDCSNINQYCN